MNAELEVDRAIAALSALMPSRNSEEVRDFRSRLSDLMTACANLCVQTETAVQLNMKNEALVVQQREDLAESRATELALRRECVELAYQTHSPVPSGNIQARRGVCSDAAPMDRLQCENGILHAENAQLHSTVKALQEQVVSCDLSLHYMEKELAGRIQQIQLVVRDLEMAGLESSVLGSEIWYQLEEELALQRHKSIVDILRRNALAKDGGMSPCPHAQAARPLAAAVSSDPRRVLLCRRAKTETLGCTVTGGRNLGTLLVISDIAAASAAEACGGLYIGDGLLAVNDVDVRDFSQEDFSALLNGCGEELDLEVVFLSHQCDHGTHATGNPASARACTCACRCPLVRPASSNGALPAATSRDGTPCIWPAPAGTCSCSLDRPVPSDGASPAVTPNEGAHHTRSIGSFLTEHVQLPPVVGKPSLSSLVATLNSPEPDSTATGELFSTF